ncbi:MAG: hypothetical protein ACC619_10665 [Paracoccaceae bacterium]
MTVRVNFSSIGMLAFSALALLVFAQEFKAFDQTHLSSLAAPRANLTNVRPLSLSGYQDALLGCDAAMSGPVAVLQTRTTRQNTARTCAALADRALRQMPTHGTASLVAARAALQRGERGAAATYLARSAQYAGFEGWLAERRFAIVMNQPPGDDFAVSATLQSDIATLLTTQSGAGLVALYFVRRPAGRATITAVASRANIADQTRLTNILSRLQATR